MYYLITELVPCGGSWEHKAFCLLYFLFLGNKPQPPWPSLSSKGQPKTLANQGREGMQRPGRSLGAGPGASSRNIHKNIFEFCRTKTPNKWKPERRTIRTSPGATKHQLWRRMKACIYPDPYLWLYFLPPNYNTTLYYLPKEGAIFRALACCDLICLAKQ